MTTDGTVPLRYNESGITYNQTSVAGLRITYNGFAGGQASHWLKNKWHRRAQFTVRPERSR